MARIFVLADNAALPGFGCEWGLALALELDPRSGGGLWLWDTGKTALFLQNAAALGVDVAAARGLGLSHGHYDHTGGLNALCAAGFAGPVYAHPDAALPRFAEEPEGRPRRQIGPPSPLPEFLPAGAATLLAPGLTMLSGIPRAPGAFQAVQGFSLDPQGATPDAVADDACLVLEGAAGPSLVLGCCHSGLANSLSCARERLGVTRVHTVLGGLHLYQAGPDALDETARALTDFGVQRLIAGHCTGQERVDALAARLPGVEVRHLAAGQAWDC